MPPRYKHRCPGCRRLLFTQAMYCRVCASVYPERQDLKLYYGQQKWLKGQKLCGIPLVEPRMIIKAFGRVMCLECGYDLSFGTKHKCYTKSRASGFMGQTIVCSACITRKTLGRFPVIVRRIRGYSTDVVRLHICSDCLHGKPLVRREVVCEAK